MPGMKRPMRDDRHTLSLVVSAVVAAVLARIGAARQPSPAGSRQPWLPPCPRPLATRPMETVGFQPVARGRNAMMPPVLPAG